MPIKKFERSQSIDLPTVARVRKGGEMRTSSKGKQMPGKDLEHFRVEFEPRFEYLESTFKGLYGTDPDVFPGVELTGFTANDAFPHWMEEWGGGMLKRRCDGERQTGGLDRGEPCRMTCGCKGIGRLSFRLPAMEEVTGVIGSYLIATSSMHDIAHLAGRIASFEKLYGTLQGVRFVIGREKRAAVTKDSSGKKMKSIKSLVYIEIDPEWSTGQTQRPATPQTQIRWSQQPKRADAFLNWAAERFKMRPDGVIAALKNIQSDVAVLDDFRGSEVSAAAAIVAYECDYIPQRIQGAEKISDAVREEAMSIAGAIAEAGLLDESDDNAYEENFGDKGFPL